MYNISIKLFFLNGFCFIFFATLLLADDKDFENITQNLSNNELQLLNEYRTAFSQIKKIYSNLSMEAEEDRFFLKFVDGVFPTPDDKQEYTLQEKRRYSYFVNDDKFFRVDIVSRVTSEFKKPFENSIYILNPSESYKLSKPDGGQYNLQLHGKTSDEFLFRVKELQFHNSPYVCNSRDILEHIFSNANNQTISQVKLEMNPNTGDEEVIILLEYSFPEYRGNGEFRFLRNKGWVLSSYKGCSEPVKNDGKRFYRTLIIRNEYEGEKDGVALIKKIQWEYAVGAQRETQKIQEKRIFTINMITVASPPMSVFDVKQFFPYTIGKYPRYNFFRITCVVLGLIFIAIGLFLLRKKR
jgi:hypothetical protein